MVRTHWAFYAIPSVLLLGCGSPDDPQTSGWGGPTPKAANQAPTGVWRGTIAAHLGSAAHQALGLVNGRQMWLLVEDGPTFFGSINTYDAIYNSELAADLTGVASAGMSWPDGSTVASFALNGTYSSESMIGTFLGAGDGGSISLDIDQIPTEFTTVEGMWVQRDQSLNIRATLVIDADWNIDGNDADGCIYSGSVSYFLSELNTFPIDLTIENCRPTSGLANGDYAGLGTMTDDNVAGADNNGTFIISVTRRSPIDVAIFELEKI